jgi:protein-arginine kinase
LKNEWPSGRGIFINNAKTFIVKVNNLDHLEISYEIEDTGMMEAIDKLIDTLALIEEKMKFAHDYKLGYVTSLPKNINEFHIKIKLKIHEDLKHWQEN